MWVLYVFGSALFAGLTSILAKCGIKKTDSNIATAIRTIVVLIFSWIMALLLQGIAGWPCECGSTYRQTQYSCDYRIFVHCIQGEADTEIIFRTCIYNSRNAAYACLGVS